MCLAINNEDIYEKAIDLYQRYNANLITKNQVYQIISNYDDKALESAILATNDKRIIIILGVFARELDTIKIACDRVIKIENAEIAKEFFKELTGFFSFCDIIKDKMKEIKGISKEAR